MGNVKRGPDPLRVVVYARVSKADGGGRTVSVDEQLNILRQLVQKHGGTIAAECEDRAISASGSAKARPGWARVLKLVESGDVDAVAVWEVSRSSRRLAEWAAFRDLCRDSRVKWLTPDAGLVEPYSQRDRLSLGVKAVVAEEEAEQTSQRIKRSVRERAAEGRPHGRDMYGYRRVYDQASGRLTGVEVEPAEAEVLRRLASEVLDGRPLRAIVRDLAAEGVPCPSDAIAARRGRPVKGYTWTTRVVADLLRSKTYIGVRVHRERDRFNGGRIVGTAEHPAAWDPILTPAQHDALVALLDDPARNTRHDNLPGVRHWLSGVLRCGKCGGVMRHDTNRRKGTDRVSRYYNCSESNCRGVSVDESVEAVVEAVIVARLSMPDAVPALAPGEGGEMAERRALLASAQSRLDDLADAYASGRVSLAAFTAAEKRLAVQVDDARRAIAEASAPGLPAFASSTPDPAEAWEGWDAPARRAVAGALFEKILVKPSGRTGRPAKGARAVDPARLGFHRRGTTAVVWGQQ